jgi:hypothetical protein
MRCGTIVLSQIFGWLVVVGLHFGLSGEGFIKITICPILEHIGLHNTLHITLHNTFLDKAAI